MARVQGEFVGFTYNRVGTTNYTAGQIATLEDIVVVALTPINASNTQGTLVTKTNILGEVTVGNAAVAFGDKAFFDPSDGLVYNATASGRVECGFFIGAYAASATDAQIYFDGNI